MTDKEQFITDRQRELLELQSMRYELSEQNPSEMARIIVVDELIHDCLAAIKELEEP